MDVEFAHDRLAPPTPISQPRLLVDWGDTPRVGHQSRPEFFLICPGYGGRPQIAVIVDQELDHDPSDPLRQPHWEDDGLWSFHVPFRLTSSGLDCRPGQYLIDVRVSFPEGAAGQHRCFRGRIRLKVPPEDTDRPGVLEIDGDGQSIVNLQGADVKQFSRIVLKAGADSVINLSNQAGVTAPASPSRADNHCREYILKVDQEQEELLPRLAGSFTQRTPLDRAGLFLDNGRRVLLLAKRQVSLGRNRDNDIVVRFMPPSEANDRRSRNVSRTHAQLHLTDEGLLLRDDSRTGIELGGEVVRKEKRIIWTGDPVRLNLGCAMEVDQPFSFDLHALVRPSDLGPSEARARDEIYARLLGEQLDPTWRTALSSSIDAVRLTRVNRSDVDEEYVLLYREAPIGGSPSSCAVVFGSMTGPPVARLFHLGRSFWLECLRGATAVRVDGRDLAVRDVVPLALGQKLMVAGVSATFDHFAQVGLE